MRQKVGAIDLGSNSLRLLLGFRDETGLYPIREELRETRLGEKLRPGGFFYPPAKLRTLKTLSKMLKIMIDENVEKGVIAATGAVRDAADGAILLEEIRKVSPYPVCLLSGREEAFYGFKGAVHSFDGGMENADTLLAIDLGGRSCEISWQEQNTFQYCSFSFGAVSLHETFFSTTQQKKWEFHALQEHVRQVLQEEQDFAAATACRVPVGLGGTITTVAAVLHGLRHFESGCVHGKILNKTEIDRMGQVLRRATPQQRTGIIPFAPQRADIITAGTAALLVILEYLKKKTLKVSEDGLIHGLLRYYC